MSEAPSSRSPLSSDNDTVQRFLDRCKGGSDESGRTATPPRQVDDHEHAHPAPDPSAARSGTNRRSLFDK